MRSRLFADGSPGSGQPHRLAYVMGTSSRLYDETPINAPAKGRFPALALAKGLAQHIDSMGLLSLEPVHIELLWYSIQDDPDFSWPKAGTEEKWLEVYRDLKNFLILALVDAELHALASAVLERFWLSESVGDKCLTGSEQTTIKAMGYLYGGLDKSKIEEADLIAFLTKLRDAEEAPWMGQWLRQVIEDFKTAKPSEFARSKLGSLF